MLIYGVTSVGATVHLHYCMNQFVGWELSHNKEDDKCGKCGMKDKKAGCCKDEHKQIKLSSDQKDQQIKDLVLPTNLAPATIPTSFIQLPAHFEPNTIVPFTPQISPPRQNIALFISYCSFLI